MTTENSRADALTGQIDAAMELAHRWATATYHKGLSKPYEDFDEIRKQLRIALRELAASPVEQHAAAPNLDAELSAFVRKSIESLSDSPKSFLASVQRAIEDQAVHELQPAPSPADERAARVSLSLTHEQVSALYVHLVHRNRSEFGWIESPLIAIEEALKPAHNAIHDRGFNAMSRQFFGDDRFKFDEAEMPPEIVPQARAASANDTD